MNAFISLVAAVIGGSSLATAAAALTLAQWIEMGVWLVSLEPEAKRDLSKAEPFLRGLIAKLDGGQPPAMVASHAYDFAQRNQDNWDEQVRKFWGGKYPGEYA